MKSFEYPTELYEKKHKQFRNLRRLRTVLKKLKIENKPLYKVIKEIFVIEKNKLHQMGLSFSITCVIKILLQI